MKLFWTDKAWEDYTYWRRRDPDMLKKINGLIEDIGRHPFRGLGKPEMLKFALAPVTFVNAKGERTQLRADIEELRAQAEALKRNGPVHKRPEGKVEVFKPDAPEDKAVVAEDKEPEPQTLRDDPRAYEVPKLHPYKPPAHNYSKKERAIGEGREGIGEGPDPSKIGPHVGFRIPQR